MIPLAIVFTILLADITYAQDDKDIENYHIPDRGMGAAHFQILVSADGAQAYNAGLWAWQGVYLNMDLTAIRGADMGDVYGVDMAMGIMPDSNIFVGAVGVVAGYNVDGARPFLALYPEVSYVFKAGEQSIVSILGRYYVSTEGTDENLAFFGVGVNWLLDP